MTDYKPEWHVVVETIVADHYDKYHRLELNSKEMLLLVDALITVLEDFTPFKSNKK